MKSEHNKNEDTEPPNWLQCWTDQTVIYMTIAAFPLLVCLRKTGVFVLILG